MKSINISPGSLVQHKGSDCVVLAALDMLKVLVIDLDTRKKDAVFISDLQPPKADDSTDKSAPALELIPDEDWKEAQRKFELIRPLLLYPRNCYADVEAIAAKAGVHASTIYEWRSLYRASGRVSALLPNRSSGGKGKPRIDSRINALVDAVIKDVYLTAKKPSVTKTIEEVLRRCAVNKIEPCHPNTVRNRIRGLPPREKIAGRYGKDAAENSYGSAAGDFPSAEFPMSVVQIDHTRANVIIVDNKYRLPIGRPWVTLAIDVHTRCIPGFHISLDTPNSVAVGMAIAMTMLPKEHFIAKRQLSCNCPVYGKPRMIYVDNAREFRSDANKNACIEHGIILEFRPKKTPAYGGHIERLMGTIKEEMRFLDGTTLDGPDERENYDSEAEARMTLDEFIDWFATMIWGKYHNRIHSELGLTPLAKFESVILGSDQQPGIGHMPMRIVDEDRLLLDFLPSFQRTIQREGVEIDGVGYYSSVLRPYINACLQGRYRVKERFQFKRDPRAISPVWFYDPKAKSYFPVPYRQNSRPVVSTWELEAAKRRLRDQGKESHNEAALFRAIDEMRQMQETAAKKTKSARLAQQRREENKKIAKPVVGTSELFDDNTWASEPIKPLPVDIDPK